MMYLDNTQSVHAINVVDASTNFCGDITSIIKLKKIILIWKPKMILENFIEYCLWFKYKLSKWLNKMIWFRFLHTLSE